MILALVLAHLCVRDDMTAQLEEIRSKYGLPAMAAALVPLHGDTQVWATGTLVQGGSERATPKSIWHLGSCTKAMTVAVLAQLVQEGQVRLSDTLPKLFPELKVDPGFQQVTLRHLLAMQGGISGNPPKTWWAYNDLPGGLLAQRSAVAKDGLESPPEFPVGEYHYSNWGLTIAAYVAEKRLKEPIEAILSKRLFGPLGMKSAGWGENGPHEPAPHDDQGPIRNFSDNPPPMSAAGRAHMSLEDWGKFAREVIRCSQGTSKVLPRLYTQEIDSIPLGGSYAMGWIRAERSWAKGIAYAHTGSNTANTATIWIAPKIGYALIAATNSGAKDAKTACDDVIVALIGKIP